MSDRDSWHDTLAVIRALAPPRDLGLAAELVGNFTDGEQLRVMLRLVELVGLLSEGDQELVTTLVAVRAGDIDPETGEPT